VRERRPNVHQPHRRASGDAEQSEITVLLSGQLARRRGGGVTRLRYLGGNAPHLLRYPMEVVASHVLERQLPCGTRIAQAGGDYDEHLAH